MKAYLAWAWGIGLSSMALGCGVDTKPGTDEAPRALIDALMAHVHIKGALLKSGDLLEPTEGADKVKLATPDGTLRLRPRATSLMPLEVEHPDREPALQSTLMQFDGAQDHFQIPIGEPGGGAVRTLALEHEFEVDEEICEGLCNQRYAAKLILSMQLEGDEISERHVIDVVLDCRERGDAAFCEDAPPPAPDEEPEMDAATNPMPGMDGGTADGGSEDAAAMADAASGSDGGAMNDAGMDAATDDAAPGDAAAGQDGAPPADAGPVEPPQIATRTPDTVNAASAFALTIEGTGFSTAAVAYVDGYALDTLSVDETTLVADVTSTATGRSGTLAVYVENVPGDASSRSNVLYILVNPPSGAPVIYDYSPDNGVAGDTVLIIASNLMGQTLAIQDDEGTSITPGTVSSISWPGPGTVDTVEVVLPSGIATGPITVANELGSFRGKIFNVGNNLTRLPGTVIESSSQYNDAQWGRASGADHKLATSFFTAVGDCATATSCTIDPWFKVTFPEPQTVARIAMRGNREYYSGYDFIRGRFEVLGAADAVLFTGDYDLPLPDRDLDIVLPEPIEGAAAVRFSSLVDESSEPGFSELEVFGP